MKDSQKPDHVSLANMVGRLREGRYVIPDFQRDFEWEPWDIKELMSSIFRDYFIETFVKEIELLPDNAVVRYTVPVPDDSLIPAKSPRDTAERLGGIYRES